MSKKANKPVAQYRCRLCLEFIDTPLVSELRSDNDLFHAFGDGVTDANLTITHKCRSPGRLGVADLLGITFR